MSAEVIPLFADNESLDVADRDQLIEQLNLRFAELRGDLGRRLDNMQESVDDTRTSMTQLAHDEQVGELARERIETQLSTLNSSMTLYADTAIVAQLRHDFDAHLLMHRTTDKRRWDVRLALVTTCIGILGAAIFEGIKWLIG